MAGKCARLLCRVLGHRVVGYAPWDGEHWMTLFYYCTRCGKEVADANSDKTKANSHP